MRRPDVRSDLGSALVLVLVLMTILALALGAMFANAGANLAASAVITGQDNKVYAVDAGVESAIQQLRGNATLCPAPAPAPGTETFMAVDQASTLNGIPVTLSCQTIAGRATTVSPWALVTTDPGAGSLANPNGAVIDGPVYVRGGVISGSTVEMGTGWYQYSNDCPGGQSRPSEGIGPWTCTVVGPPDPKPGPPPSSILRPRGPDPAYTVAATDCSIFLPGIYTKINLGAHNYYFASGVYYFQDSLLALQGNLVGGQPGAGETQVVTTSSPCATDRLAGVDDGTGVEFVLGGSSRIDLGSHDMELYRRLPGVHDEGAAGLSIRTVPADTRPYRQSSIPTGTNVLAMASGAHLAVHGMVYVPQAPVAVFASNGGSSADLSGGLECSALAIGPSARGSNGRVVSTQNGPQSRTVVITATTQGTARELRVTSTAVVAIGNDPARTVTVQSWTTAKG